MLQNATLLASAAGDPAKAFKRMAGEMTSGCNCLTNSRRTKPAGFDIEGVGERPETNRSGMQADFLPKAE